MTPDEIAADLAAFVRRREFVDGLHDAAKADPTMKLPGGVTFDQLQLAVQGDPRTGQRIPLTFSVRDGELSHDLTAAAASFAQFQRELKAVFDSEGITDAVVVQLGSGTTGWSTAPGTYTDAAGTTKPKLGKPWAPTSDTDFAIFSDQALHQAMAIGAPVNPKNKQAGEYTTIKNGDPGDGQFADTPLGKKLFQLSTRWNERIYGSPDAEGFDFKLNLDASRPFRSAVPVLTPTSASSATGSTP